MLLITMLVAVSMHQHQAVLDNAMQCWTSSSFPGKLQAPGGPPQPAHTPTLPGSAARRAVAWRRAEQSCSGCCAPRRTRLPMPPAPAGAMWATGVARMAEHEWCLRGSPGNSQRPAAAAIIAHRPHAPTLLQTVGVAQGPARCTGVLNTRLACCCVLLRRRTQFAACLPSCIMLPG